MTILVSVITPVYNARPEQVARAVDSVARQGVTCEMIVVDDGSSPELAQYLDELARSRFFLKVVHKKNEGVSSARNVAIELCEGDYIFFLDADDEITTGALEAAVKMLRDTGCDAVYGNSVLIFPDGKERTSFPRFANSPVPALFINEQLEYLKVAQFRPDALQPFGLPEMLIPNNWGAVFRGDLIRKLRFDTDVVMAEDRLFNLKVFSIAKRVAVTDSVWYKYYQYSDTATHRIRPNALREFETTASKYKGLLPSGGPLLINALYSGIFECFLQCLIFTIPRSGFRQNMHATRAQYVKAALQSDVFQTGIMNAQPTNAWQKLLLRLARGCHSNLILIAIVIRSIIKK